ncbi:unnamed protein product [Chrysoparadoxa australica]
MGRKRKQSSSREVGRSGMVVISAQHLLSPGAGGAPSKIGAKKRKRGGTSSPSKPSPACKASSRSTSVPRGGSSSLESTEERLHYILEAASARRSKGSEALTAVVLVCDPEMAQHTSALLRALLVRSYVVHSRMTKAQRRDQLQRFHRAGSNQAGTSALVLPNEAVGLVGSLKTVHLAISQDSAEHAGRSKLISRLEQTGAQVVLLSNEVECDPSVSRAVSERVALALRVMDEGEPSQARRKLGALLSTPLMAPAGGQHASEGKVAGRREIRKRMAVLGMTAMARITRTAAGSKEKRLAAETSWIDGAPGDQYGGTWRSVRLGASCDEASLQVRRQVSEALAATPGGKAAGQNKGKGKGKGLKRLGQWRPNPSCADEDAWGGPYGKPCAHNEVVMHHLRPFAPMEITNTRLCSEAAPAPGNEGYHGCQEYLQIQCRIAKRALTIWDPEAFHYITSQGRHTQLAKNELLHIPTPLLKHLVTDLRRHTCSCNGQRAPRELLWAILFLTHLGSRPARIATLTSKLSARVLSFVISGDSSSWASLLALR